METIDRLYKKGNYTIQKSINLEDKLYTRLKEIADNDFENTLSDLVNICIEELLKNKTKMKYYEKPQYEITIYRSIMMRKSNIEKLEKIKCETGISVTRLVNISIKDFLDSYNKK